MPISMARRALWIAGILLLAATVIQAATLSDALDDPQLVWVTGGDAPWISQTATNIVSPPPESTSMSKLTLHAITELISLAEQCEVLCPAIQANSGIDSPPRGKPVSAPTSRRSCRR